jgi:hypothetical protein
MNEMNERMCQVHAFIERKREEAGERERKEEPPVCHAQHCSSKVPILSLCLAERRNLPLECSSAHYTYSYHGNSHHVAQHV